MNRHVSLIFVLITLVLHASGCTPRQEQVNFELFAAGFSKPIGLYSALDGTDRLFVLEQNGVIRIVINGSTVKTPFLDISDMVSSGKEQGLLGMAFHPLYEKNGLFYLNYTDKKGSTTIAQFKTSIYQNLADKKSERILLRIKQPYQNHNAGAMAFGPDGYLYIATGNGGGVGDPNNNAQSLQSYLGKILRIDVDHGKPYAIPEGNPYKYVKMANVVREIWLRGFRNPWRFSFDAKSGDMFIADVGQDSYEEIDLFKYKDQAGKNYGWNIMEASHCYPRAEHCDTRYLELPILEYKHNKENGYSVTGGYLYRGSNKELYGKYIFGDFVSGNIWAAHQEGEKWTMELIKKTGFKISSFGQDKNNELYIVDYAGKIYKMQ